MPTTTPLDPSETLTPSLRAPCIQVRDLIAMLSGEDPDAWVQVVTRIADEPDEPLGDNAHEAVKEALEEVVAESLADELATNSLAILRKINVAHQGRRNGVSTDETENRYCEGIVRAHYNGRKVVVVR